MWSNAFVTECIGLQNYHPTSDEQTSDEAIIAVELMKRCKEYDKDLAEESTLYRPIDWTNVMFNVDIDTFSRPDAVVGSNASFEVRPSGEEIEIEHTDNPARGTGFERRRNVVTKKDSHNMLQKITRITFTLSAPRESFSRSGYSLVRTEVAAAQFKQMMRCVVGAIKSRNNPKRNFQSFTRKIGEITRCRSFRILSAAWVRKAPQITGRSRDVKRRTLELEVERAQKERERVREARKKKRFEAHLNSTQEGFVLESAVEVARREASKQEAALKASLGPRLEHIWRRRETQRAKQEADKRAYDNWQERLAAKDDLDKKGDQEWFKERSYRREQRQRARKAEDVQAAWRNAHLLI